MPKISALPLAVAPTGDDLVAVVQAGVTKKATLASLPIQSAVIDALALKAPLASPALTGTPTAPTAATANNTTLLATTAFVQQELLAGGATARALVVSVRNQSGATMTAGTVVYINGSTGNLPTIAKAIATSDATSAQTLGLVRTSIANNDTGLVVVRGILGNLNTSGLTEGQQLYLSPTTAGTYTTTKQHAPNHLVYIGIVTRAHPTIGAIEVAVQNGFEMDELHNVSAQSPNDGDILRYSTATSLWEKSAAITDLVASKFAVGRISEIDARKLPNGALTSATIGRLKTIAGDSASVTVSSGKIISSATSGAAYITLECDDVVQRLTALVEWPIDANATLALIIPHETSSFPGVGGAAAAGAGVHCIVPCWFNGAPIAQVSSGGYGSAAAITGKTVDVFSRYPLQNTTRTVELLYNKATGRVTVSIDTEIVFDYYNAIAKNFVGKYGIFEFYNSTSNPRFISIEASSEYRSPASASLTKLGGSFFSSATAIPSSFANTSISTDSGNTGGANELVTVSVWIDQTAGDTVFRLTNGFNFTADVVVARGAFNGRVTYIEQFGSGLDVGRTITLQAKNSSGSATFGAYSSVGWARMVSQGMPRAT